MIHFDRKVHSKWLPHSGSTPHGKLAHWVATGFCYGLCGGAWLCMAVCCAGVVNDEVQKRADDHRFGRNPVKASDHVLVLNWNENTPALLQNIAVAVSSAAEAKAEAGLARGAALSAAGGLWSKDPAVVVLADKSKAEMDAAVQEVIR